MITVQRAAMEKYSTFDAADPYPAASDPDIPYVPVPKPGHGSGGRPAQLMYILTEYPGENPVSWRRNLYGLIGHGVKMIDLFQFKMSQSSGVQQSQNQTPVIYRVALLLRSYLTDFDRLF
eukprot:SAG11_NODE_3475_length_2425_cov_1.455718_1_plen_120_part_00